MPGAVRQVGGEHGVEVRGEHDARPRPFSEAREDVARAVAVHAREAVRREPLRHERPAPRLGPRRRGDRRHFGLPAEHVAVVPREPRLRGGDVGAGGEIPHGAIHARRVTAAPRSGKRA